MGDKGSKDKGNKEEKKKSPLTPKEKKQLKRDKAQEKKNNSRSLWRFHSSDEHYIPHQMNRRIFYLV